MAKPQLNQNAQIQHPRFGCGSVLSCDEEYVVIKFDDHGEKKFIASIVLPNLTKIDRDPPAEKRTRTRRARTKRTVTATS